LSTLQIPNINNNIELPTEQSIGSHPTLFSAALGSHYSGLGYRTNRPNRQNLVEDWGSLVRFAVKVFGDRRVMFGSNYPMERGLIGLGMFWDAVKIIVAHGGYSKETVQRLLSGNANDLYGRSDPGRTRARSDQVRGT